MYWLLFILWGLNAIMWKMEEDSDPHWACKLWIILSAVNSVTNLLMAISC